MNLEQVYKALKQGDNVYYKNCEYKLKLIDDAIRVIKGDNQKLYLLTEDNLNDCFIV